MSDLLKIIKNKAYALNIDAISFGDVKKLNECRKKFNDPFLSPLKFFDNAKIYISAAISFRENWNLIDSCTEGYIARYTTANFYKILSKKLEILAKFCKELINPNIKNSDFYRIFVNSKINDKLAAYASNLGYYANNSLIFIENKGTNFIIGELFLNLDLKIEEYNIKKDIDTTYCKNCKICINSCPLNAISENFKVNKSICLQYLSCEKNFYPDKEKLKIWGKRFFGCSDCVDNCPMNVNNIKQNKDYKEYYGYIGTTFNLENIINFSKEDYKEYFKHNQIGTKWIEPFVLARNIIMALYNCDKKELIIKYNNNLKKYGWNKEEIEYLKYILNILINLK